MQNHDSRAPTPAPIRRDDDEQLIFAPERARGPAEDRQGRAGAGWPVLVVDDDEEVHRLTRFVLGDFCFADRPIEFLRADSAAAARGILARRPDVAVVLLDVVMESDDAGLVLVRHIRETLGNTDVRIILRTGQPGYAPESEVVAQYDINDYKCKAELTAQRLATSVTAALRAWRDIQAVRASREGLHRVLQASRRVHGHLEIESFVSDALAELVGLLADGAGRGPGALSGLAAQLDDGAYRIVAASGDLAGHEGRTLTGVLAAGDLALVSRARDASDVVFTDRAGAVVYRTDSGNPFVLLLRGEQPLSDLEQDLVRLYVANTRVAFRNLALGREIIETQKEIIDTLGQVVETRSSETAHHVTRVGRLAERLAQLAGIAQEERKILHLAVPMHDVGKVGIPDAILNKPGPLTAAEREVMERHTVIGHRILANSGRRIMRTAATIALEHHERWDGGGYPQRLCGEQIHLHARITALVDVVDALASERVYRPALPLAEVFAHVARERSAAFDPRLVDLLLAHRDEFAAILAALPDAAPAAATAPAAAGLS